ncbi:LysR family transcriptional regulator [Chitinasiproducens palmae]|uniref:DNA-binding transcriptional regulator, LysR family n=1 Tax=Chitinasiproducens palmae TaxID=1770053 RepID=A0A1H2PLN2_9BURK|nr:LysR substrate-binding domain-containing protein [Chitinasiproducens palmae]SDV47369.1 DNA-binding transcriptional regulator, LysR family [Chitinasiproducens palmae]
MELRQLRAVLAIADTGSVTKAAEQLHVVQPAISRQLRIIEGELGTALFVRASNGMALTEEGRAFVNHARKALSELDQAVTDIRPAKGVVSGLVSVGMLPSVSDHIAGMLLAEVQRLYPLVRLRLSCGYAGELQEWVQDGTVDLAVLYDAKANAAIEAMPLLDEPLYLVCSNTLPLPKGERVPLDALRNLPLILPSGRHSVRGILEDACAVAGIALDVIAEADATQLTKALLLSGAGYTVLAGIAIADSKLKGQVSSVPLGIPPLRRRVTLCSGVVRRELEPVRRVREVVQTIVHRLTLCGEWPGAVLLAAG